MAIASDGTLCTWLMVLAGEKERAGDLVGGGGEKEGAARVL